MQTEKFCRGCEITKPAADYYKIKGKYLSALCKLCDVKKATAYGAANPERRKQYARNYRDKNVGTVAYRVRHIHEGMVERSRKRGWPRPEFTKAEIAQIVTGGHCAQTGLPFEFDVNAGRTNPWTPVPDRVDPALPYTKSNVQWVCNIYNAAKQSWTDADVWKMIHAAAQAEGDF